MELPPKYANVPTAYLFNRDIPDAPRLTLAQLCALSWANKYTWVRVIGIEFQELTGTNANTLYHHLLILQKAGVLSFASLKNQVWDVTFDSSMLTTSKPEKDADEVLQICKTPININSSSSDLVVNSSARDALARHYSGRGDFDLAKWPEDTRDVVNLFCRLWHMTPPQREKDRAAWISDCRELLSRCGKFTAPALEAERRSFEEYMSSHGGLAPYTIGGLRSVLNTVNVKAGQLRQAEAARETTSDKGGRRYV